VRRETAVRWLACEPGQRQLLRRAPFLQHGSQKPAAWTEWRVGMRGSEGLLPVRQCACLAGLTLTGLVCGAAGVDARRGESLPVRAPWGGESCRSGACLPGRRGGAAAVTVLLDLPFIAGARFEALLHSTDHLDQQWAWTLWWRGESCVQACAGRGRTALRHCVCQTALAATGQPQACREAGSGWASRVIG
jgi:hypothetical protein